MRGCPAMFKLAIATLACVGGAAPLAPRGPLATTITLRHRAMPAAPSLMDPSYSSGRRTVILEIMSDPNEDFAALFEASLKQKRIERGQTIEGAIVAIGPEVAFVNVGGKGEAMIEIDELKDAEGNLEVAAGDRIQAMVVSTAGGLTLSRKLVLGAATERQLQDAFRTGLPVEGKVEKAVKGGYEVRIARQRAFCPISQIDTIRNTDPSEHEGRVYAFRIIEYKEGG